MLMLRFCFTALVSLLRDIYLSPIRDILEISVFLSKLLAKLKKSRYRISIRGPTIWNQLLTKSEKKLEHCYFLATA